MTELIAIHTIMRKHPSGGGLQSIKPGSTFVSDLESEYEPLVRSGAARVTGNVEVPTVVASEVAGAETDTGEATSRARSSRKSKVAKEAEEPAKADEEADE